MSYWKRVLGAQPPCGVPRIPRPPTTPITAPTCVACRPLSRHSGIDNGEATLFVPSGGVSDDPASYTVSERPTRTPIAGGIGQKPRG